MQDASRDYNRKLRRRDGFCYPKDSETSGAARLLYSISFLLISIFRKNIKIGLMQKVNKLYKRKSVPLYGVSSQNV